MFLLKKISLFLACLLVTSVQARVTRIQIDQIQQFPNDMNGGVATEQIAGQAFGELDPRLIQNSVINDIQFVKDADGKVRYVATFVITKPVNSAQASGLMWHEVPNRGMRRPNVPAERKNGDIDLVSAWQGDNSGATSIRASAEVDKPHWLKVPIARQSDGTPFQGDVFGRIVNRSGMNSQPLIVQSNPLPYKPMTLETQKARLVSRVAESTRGEVIGENEIPSTEWAWAKCDASKPFPGTPDHTQICLKSGFDSSKLYQVVYRSAEPYALGIGFAAWRDVGHFSKQPKQMIQERPIPLLD
jgi:hypothetical protein